MPGDDSSIDIFPEFEGIEVLQKTTIFAKLGFEETRRLADIMKISTFPQGHLFIEQDSLGQALFIVRLGEVAVYRRISRGGRDLLDKLRAGEIFGEMSLIDDLLVSADIEVASETAEVVIVPRREFEILLKEDEHIALKIYRGFCHTLSDRLRSLSVRYAELARSSRPNGT